MCDIFSGGYDSFDNGLISNDDGEDSTSVLDAADVCKCGLLFCLVEITACDECGQMVKEVGHTIEKQLNVGKSPLPRTRTRTISQSSSKRYPILRSFTRTIYTAGRPPWYDPAGQHVEPCVIGNSKLFAFVIPCGSSKKSHEEILINFW